jgi:uncharacterized protein YacL
MDVKLHYFSNKINPAGLLFYIPFIKKKFERKNQDPWEEFNKVFTNKRNGFSIWTSHVIMIGVIFGILISSFIIISRVFNLYDYVPKFLFIICAGISMFIGNFYILKKDKYLDYFEKYEMWTKREKRKYVIISFFVIIATIAYFFMSLMCC